MQDQALTPARLETRGPLYPSGLLWAIEPLSFRQMLQAAGPEVTGAIRIGLVRERMPPPFELRGSTAIIAIRGPLYKTASVWDYYYGATSYEWIAEGVAAALVDDAVETILLRVDSPGGSVDGLSDAGDALFAARSQKQLIAQVDGLAASAAYYLAAQAKQIFAGRMDLVGSIGTSAVIYDWSRFFANAGIEAVHLNTGPLKNIGVFGTEITPAQRDYIQDLVDTYFADFITAVARGRGQSEAEVREKADGRVIVASQPAAASLIDGIQSLDQTLAQLGANDAIPGPLTSSGLQPKETDMQVVTENKAGEVQNTPVPAATAAIAPVPVPVKRPASAAELRTLLEGSTAEFREECLVKGLTTFEALQAHIDDQRTRIAELNAAVKVGSGPVVGTEVAGNAGGVTAADTTDPEAAFIAERQKLRDAGKTVTEAHRELLREQPELCEAYEAAYNKRFGRPTE